MKTLSKSKRAASSSRKTKPAFTGVSPVEEVEEVTEEKVKKAKTTAEHESKESKSNSETKETETLSDAESVQATSADFMEKMNEAVDMVDEVGEKFKADEKKVSDKVVQIKAHELEFLRHELEEAKDRGLRALAELENYRNRTNRSIQEDRKYASLDLARALLPVWDNMGRALEAAEKEVHPEAILDGLKMMNQQFLDILKLHHIETIDALHKPFDPNFHESIAQLPNAEYPPNTVIVVSQPGFKLYDRVVRPAQVVLSAPVPKAES